MTSKKHREFVAEPMGMKSVTALPGIGLVHGAELIAAGFIQADHVLGQYLILGKNEALFDAWLKEITGANSKHSSDCYNGLKGWFYNFMM